MKMKMKMMGDNPLEEQLTWYKLGKSEVRIL